MIYAASLPMLLCAGSRRRAKRWGSDREYNISAGSQGFSILEVLAVLFVIGMFATLLVSRLVDTSAELAAESEMVKAHLRFAQSRAMNAEVSLGNPF